MTSRATLAPSPAARLEPRAYDHDDARTLVLALYDDQVARYGHAEDPHCDARAFLPPDGLFLVAYSGDEPIGCGGFRRHDPCTIEIKRMYVRRAHRGLGHGARILAELEAAADAAGARRLILETGARNISACLLYEQFGYVPIPGYSANRRSGVNRAYARLL
jgi:GNAT superfamily N-acetyltransferase